MNLIIMRLGTSNFGHIGTYNVQEVGLANAMIKLGHKVTVLYLNKETDTVIQDDTYDYVYYLPHKHIGIHGIFDVKLLEKYNPEGIILFSDSQLWSKNVIEWSAKRNIPCIHYFGNVLSDNPRWINQAYTKLILARNRRSYEKSINIAKTKKVQREMESLNVKCAGVINVGLDDDILQPNKNLDISIRDSLGYETDETVLLFVGRLVSYKNPLMACDILKAMLDQGIKTKLVIIGKGSQEEQLIHYIKQLDIENKVSYVGRVPYAEMYKYFVACDCIINLSPKEIFGMTILEAMYYGLPVVAHTAPGPNDIITDGVNGYLCDSDEIGEWVELINKALCSRDELGRASRKEIEDNYMWDSVAPRFCSFLK